MQKRTGWHESAAVNAVKVFIVLGMLLLTPGMQPALLAQARADVSGFEAARARLNETLDLVEQLRAALDRRLFDLDALAFELAFEEPEGLRDWLSENIAYQPYRGVLRGAEGTLISGAGNSFDQALLLENLLRNAGYDTRIMVGELSEADARTLLATTAAAPDDGNWREAAAAVLNELDGLTGEHGLDYAAVASALRQLLAPVEVDAQLLGRAELAAGQLTAALAAHGVELGSPAALTELIEAAAEHAWVEYRLGEGADWTPLPASLPAGIGLPEAHTELLGEVPGEYVHRLRIEAFAESKEGDTLEVNPVMGRWEMPTAYLNGQIVSYANAPSALGELGAGAPIGDILDASDFFIPFVDDSIAAGAVAFDLEGSLLAPDAATDQAAGVFRNVRGGFMSALGALSGLGGGADSEDDGPPLALTRFWLEYTLIAPGETVTVHERQLMDMIGADERAAGGRAFLGDSREEAELKLMREERLMAITGDYRPEWVLDEFFARFLNTRTFLEYVLALQYGVPTDIQLESAIGSASPLEHLLTSQVFDAVARSQDSLSWRAEPTLLVFGSGLSGTRADPVAVSSIDIVSNARATLSGSGLELAAGDGMLLGVWETFVESDVQASQSAEAEVIRFSAAEAIAAALAAGSDLTVLEPGADPREFGLSGEAAVNAGRDLESGYHLVLPADSGSADRSAWWRVQADTGETLGVTFDGRGQTMTEYAIKLYDDAFTLVFAVSGLNKCLDGFAGGSPAQACCLLKAHLNNVAGLGLGSVIGGSFAGVVGATASLTVNIGGAATGLDLVGGTTGLDCTAFL